MTVELAKHGFDVSGVDLSDEMLLIAQEKAADLGFIDSLLSAKYG